MLSVGDHLYNKVLEKLRLKGNFKHRLLSLDEIPDNADILSRTVIVKKLDIVSGPAIDMQGNSSLPTLHQALNRIFQNKHYVLVLIGAVCSAVFKKANKLWLFDSHSHGSNGLSTSDGNSILMSFINVDQLVTFMYTMYESMKLELSCQYEFLPLSFTEVDESDSLVEYFKDQVKRSETRQKSCQDRRKYHRDYRRSQRNDPVFKENNAEQV